MHAAQFSKTAAPLRRDSPPFALGAGQRLPLEGTEEYSAQAAAEQGGDRHARSGYPEAPMAPLARLQDLAVEALRGQVEGVAGEHLAV